MGSSLSSTTEQYTGEIKRSDMQFGAEGTAGSAVGADAPGIQPRFPIKPEARLYDYTDGAPKQMTFVDPSTALQLPAVNPLAAISLQQRTGVITPVKMRQRAQNADVRPSVDNLIPVSFKPGQLIDGRNVASYVEKNYVVNADENKNQIQQLHTWEGTAQSGVDVSEDADDFIDNLRFHYDMQGFEMDFQMLKDKDAEDLKEKHDAANLSEVVADIKPVNDGTKLAQTAGDVAPEQAASAS